MSFDLAVWEDRISLTPEEALSIYNRIVNDDVGNLPPSPKLKQFMSELTQKYPDIDHCQEDQLQNNPWTAGFGYKPEFEILSIAWPRVDDVVPYVVQLAQKHKLFCFDPQELLIRAGDLKGQAVTSNLWLRKAKRFIKPFYWPVLIADVLLFLGSCWAIDDWRPIATPIFVAAGCFLIFLLVLIKIE